MANDMKETQHVEISKVKRMNAREILTTVNKSLTTKGYNPVSQIVGYIISGDPTYITSFENSRGIITQVERDELLEEMVEFYLKNL